MSEKANTFGVTLVVRGKHAVLYSAAKAMGGQSALAKHLGVSPATLGSWVNLKSVPWFLSRSYMASTWPDRRADLEAKLYVLTGMSSEELFPEAIRTREFLDAPKTAEADYDVDLHQLASDAVKRLTLPAPDDEAEAVERREVVQKVLKTVTLREREILKMRFGLDGEPPYTYEEIGRAFKVTRERVRQIECAAVRKMQHGDRAAQLVGFRD